MPFKYFGKFKSSENGYKMSLILLPMAIITLIGVIVHSVYIPFYGSRSDLLNDFNRQSALVSNIMVAYSLGGLGLADLFWSIGFIRPNKWSILGIAGFWIFRLILQFIYYNMRQPFSWLFASSYIFLAAGHLYLLSLI